MIQMLFPSLETLKGVAGFIGAQINKNTEQERWKELFGELQALKADIDAVHREIAEGHSEEMWSLAVSGIRPHIDTIENAFSDMEQKANREDARGWATADLYKSIDHALSNLDRAIEGDGYSEGLLRTFAEKVAQESRTQTPAWLIACCYEQLLGLQVKGIVTLLNIDAIAREGVETPAFGQDVDEDAKRLHERLSAQYERETQFIKTQDDWWQSGSFGRQCVSLHEVPYADKGEVTCPRGHVVVGIRLKQVQNRVVPVIRHATPALKGGTRGDATWQANDHWGGGGYFGIQSDMYVDTDDVEADKGQVITGVRFDKGPSYANRMTVAIQQAPYDPTTGTVDDSGRTWKRSPESKNNYFSTDDHKHVHTGEISTRPDVPLTGLRLASWKDRISLRIRPYYYVPEPELAGETS